jgi:hypothetical protein
LSRRTGSRSGVGIAFVDAGLDERGVGGLGQVQAVYPDPLSHMVGKPAAVVM